MAAPLILLEVSPRRVADGVAETIYLAGMGGTTPYFYDGKHWRGGLSTLPAFINALSFQNGEFGTGGVPTAASITWTPQKDADRALMSAYVWEGAVAVIRIGTEGVFPAGVAGRIMATQSQPGSITLFFADVSQTLKVPVLTDRYAGTGGLEGPADWAGKIKERMFGRVWNRAGAPIDPANNVYCFADPTRPLQAFDAIRDMGAPAAPTDLTLLAWQGSAAATLTALKNAVAPQGGGVLCPSIACVKWWTQPGGDLCVDLRGEIGAGYVETAPELAALVVGIVGGPAMAAGTVAAAKAARPAIVGLAITEDSTTAAAILDKLLGDSSLLWIIDAAGQIVIRQWAWGASAGSFTSHEVKRVETHRPVGTRKLGYKHNENVMARGDLAAIVLASDVIYGDGQTVEELQPAQPGADVTGDNTSKDTEAVGGVPAETLINDITVANAAALQAQADAATALQQATDAQTAIEAAQQDIIANATEIQTVSNTVATQGGQITTLQSSVTANTGAISTLQTTVGTQGSAITVLQQASTTQAGQLATLKVQVTSGNPNILYNGDFANGLDGWSTTGIWGVNGASAAYGPHCQSPNPVGTVILQSATRSASAGLTYTVSARARVSGTAGSAYLDIIFLNASGGIVSDPGDGPNWVAPTEFTSSGNRESHTFTATAPAGTTQLVVRFVGNGVSGQTTQIAVQQIKLEIGSTATLWSQESTINQAYTTLQTATTQLATLQTTVSTQGASITSNATAITTLQTQTSTLTTQVTSGNPNLAPDGTAGLSKWGLASDGGALTASAVNSNLWGPYISMAGVSPAAGTYHFFISDPIPLGNVEGVSFTLAANVDTSGSGFNADDRTYVAIRWLNGSGGTISEPAGPSAYGPRSFGNSAANRAALKLTAVAPPGTQQCCIMLILNLGSAGHATSVGFGQIKLETGALITAFSSEATVAQSFQTITTLTTQYASLSTTVSTQGVTISTQQTAITTLNGNVTTLLGKWGVEIDVNGYISGILTNNNGSRSDFTIRSDKFTIVAPGGGARTEYSNGNWRVYNAAGTLKVQWGINI